MVVSRPVDTGYPYSPHPWLYSVVNLAPLAGVVAAGEGGCVGVTGGKVDESSHCERCFAFARVADIVVALDS